MNQLLKILTGILCFSPWVGHMPLHGFGSRYQMPNLTTLQLCSTFDRKFVFDIVVTEKLNTKPSVFESDFQQLFFIFNEKFDPSEWFGRNVDAGFNWMKEEARCGLTQICVLRNLIHGQIVGMVWLYPHALNIVTSDGVIRNVIAWELYNLARRANTNGIEATKRFLHFIKNEMNIDYLFLKVRSSSVSLINLYKKLGFAPCPKMITVGFDCPQGFISMTCTSDRTFSNNFEVIE